MLLVAGFSNTTAVREEIDFMCDDDEISGNKNIEAVVPNCLLGPRAGNFRHDIVTRYKNDTR
ncbi:hypothetical protein L484_019374 [Morus notabilis]|uniref:Uncharacterized protein n=1 Tax=Morus notabilis TaxID=981085 RepID=W9SAG7_9ROSA|nr:hypothetical protein L484_019374 [Morus notabilis]